MKVHTHYSDGVYSLTAAEHPSLSERRIVLPVVEISDDDWKAYQAYLDITRYWNDRIAAMERTEDYQRQYKAGWDRYYTERKEAKP